MTNVIAYLVSQMANIFQPAWHLFLQESAPEAELEEEEDSYEDTSMW